MIHADRETVDDVSVANSNPPARALVIDDEPFVAELICEALNEIGFEAEACLDSGQGVEMALSGRYSLVTTDLSMPHPDGLEVVRMIRRQKLDTPVIVISANARGDAAEEFRRLRVADIIQKPFTLDRLASAVAGLV